MYLIIIIIIIIIIKHPLQIAAERVSHKERRQIRLDGGKAEFDKRWGYETLESIKENAMQHCHHQDQPQQPGEAEEPDTDSIGECGQDVGAVIDTYVCVCVCVCVCVLSLIHI